MTSIHNVYKLWDKYFFAVEERVLYSVVFFFFVEKKKYLLVMIATLEKM